MQARKVVKSPRKRFFEPFALFCGINFSWFALNPVHPVLDSCRKKSGRLQCARNPARRRILQA
jgi:hypothetical protein